MPAEVQVDTGWVGSLERDERGVLLGLIAVERDDLFEDGDARRIVRRLAEPQARHRPLTSLPAQDCWLRGLECLRRSTPEGDEEARGLFQRALRWIG